MIEKEILNSIDSYLYEILNTTRGGYIIDLNCEYSEEIIKEYEEKYISQKCKTNSKFPGYYECNEDYFKFIPNKNNRNVVFKIHNIKPKLLDKYSNKELQDIREKYLDILEKAIEDPDLIDGKIICIDRFHNPACFRYIMGNTIKTIGDLNKVERYDYKGNIFGTYNSIYDKNHVYKYYIINNNP